MPVRFLGTLFDAGAVLLFKTPPSDRRSLMRGLERKAGKKTAGPGLFLPAGRIPALKALSREGADEL